MRYAVVGHIEWVEFARVDRVPLPGEIIHAREGWAEPAGGGAVAAVQIARLAGSCDFFTAVGDDELGRRAVERLTELGLRVHASVRDRPTRRAFTYVDDGGERTITTIGERIAPCLEDSLPWWALSGCDAVLFVAGDAGALRTARLAKILTAVSRVLPVLREGGVVLDALVGSARDPSEAFADDDLDPRPRVVVRTEGSSGGAAEPGGRFPAAELPGPLVDAYGCGDAFVAGLTYGLGAGMHRDEALGLAARCGAAALTGRGAYAGQLRLAH